MVKILIIVVFVVLIIFIYAASTLTKVVLDRNFEMQQDSSTLSKDPEEAARAVQILCGSEVWREYIKNEGEEWYLSSYDNLKLHAYFLRNDSHNYAVLCHGFTGSSTEMMGRAEHLYQEGYSVLLPDARAHGQSEGRYRGMGYLEKSDIQGWIAKIVEIDKEASIVLMGQSMGAATVIMTSGEKLPENVKAIIADCSYTSVWDEFSLQIKEMYHLPSFPIMNIANVISKYKAGYTFTEASPIAAISRNKLPVLLIHGMEDTFVPYAYLDKLYQAANEPKQKLGIEGAGHCMSVVKDGELYWKTVDGFLELYLKRALQ